MLWIIAPVYNEERNLESFVHEWLPVFRRTAGSEFVFCLINDGSTDGSLQVLQTLSQKHPELLVLDQANKGHGPSCLRGYQQALDSGADWILQIDSDGQCDPADFETFWNGRSGSAVQYGVRTGREDGWARRIISRLLSLFVFFLFFRWIRDVNVPYRLMSRESLKAVLSDLPARFRLANVLLSLLHQESGKIVWHPIRFRQRPGRQAPVRVSFFLRESIRLYTDFLKWLPGSTARNPIAGVSRLARILLGLMAGYYMLAFPLLSLLHIGFAGEYDWLEGVHMAQVHRILSGQPLYTEPSPEYTPVLYGPLYPYFAAAVAFLLGESYTMLRVLSLIAAAGAQVLIWRMIACWTKSPEAAWAATGLFAGCYAAVGFYFDKARVDSFALFFVLLHVFLVWRSRDKRSSLSVAAAVSGTLAVLAKQTSLAPVLALSLWAFFSGDRHGRRTAVLTVILAAVSQLAMHWLTGGWFGYYLYKLPASHRILQQNVMYFLESELLQWFPGLCLLSLCAVCLLLKKNRKEAFFFILLLLALTAASLAPRFKIGGSANNLIPFAALMAIGSGIAMGLAEKRKGWIAVLALCLLLGSAWQLFYNPKMAFPSRQMYQITFAGVEVFRRVNPPLFAPCDPYKPVAAGKSNSAFWGAMIDVLMTPGEAGASLERQLAGAFEEKRYSTVVLRKRFFMMDHFPLSALEDHYQSVDQYPGLLPGWKEHYRIFVPRRDPPQ